MISILPALVAVNATALAPAQEKLHCESHASSYKSREVECPLDGSEATRRFRFQADFTGSHDDTALDMTATIDGLPVGCEEGSKTRSEGEEGDVRLECSFSVGEAFSNRSILRVRLHWYHAEYTDSGLYGD